MNSMEQLLNLIREEDVALFVGAGLSCSTGLPSGSILSKEICKQLPKNLQQELVNEQSNLPKISSAYVNHKGNNREKLIKFIQQYFELHYPEDARKTPIAILPRVPHFKTIISTNYDDLVEQCYGDECIVVASNDDVPSVGARRNKTVLVKIHGDFNNPSSIVLTEEDYNDLYLAGKMDTPIWSLVKNELATKSILFLGYGYNDGNIDAILSYIDKNVRNRKKFFLISKDIPKYKQNELTAKGIVFFEKDILSFLQELIIRFDNTVIDDYNRGLISHETLSNYTKHALVPVVEGNRFIYGKPQPNVPVTFHFTSDSTTYSQIMDMDHFDPIEITNVIDYKYAIGGITIPLGRVTSILISRNPNDEFRTSIFFPDTDFEIADVLTKRYDGKTAMRLTYELAGGVITLEVNKSTLPNNGKFNVMPKDGISIKDEIEILTLMKQLVEGNVFRLTTDEGVNITCQKPLRLEHTYVKDFLQRLEHLEKLRCIEKYYGITFRIPIQLTPQNLNNATVIYRNIKGNLIEDTENDIYVRFDKTSKEKGHSLIRYDDDDFVFIDKEHVVANLYGKTIDLGYRMFKAIKPQYTEKGDKVLLSVKTGNYIFIYQPLPPESLL